MMFRSTLFAGLLVCAAAFFCAPVAAADGDGLKPGVLAPPFQLRVVNDDVFVPPVIKTGPLAPKQLRWGPGRWTGDAPDEKKKLVIMSFFATYCAPCKKEMPELSRLYDTYKDQGLGVMLISIDKGKEQLDEIIGLAKENNVSFPVLHATTQIVGTTPSAYPTC